MEGQTYAIRTTDLQSIAGEVYILMEGSELLSPEEVAERTDFVPLASVTDDLKGLENYWLKVNLVNLVKGQEQREWVLHFPLSLSQVTAFFKKETGFSAPQQTGFFVPVNQRDFAPTLKANLIKFQLMPGNRQNLLIRARSDRSSIPPEFALQIEAVDQFFLRLQRKKQINALFIGFCLMMLIYTVILYIYSRDKTYLFYALYLISIGIYVDYVNGNLHDLLIPAWIPDHPQYSYLVKLIVYGALIGYMGFFRSFLDLKQLLPRWDRFFQWLCWAAFPVLLLDLYLMLTSNFSYLIADQVTLTYALIFVGAGSLFTVSLYRSRDRKGRFVVFGLIFMGLGILATAIDRMRTVDYTVLYFEIGGTIELVIFSVGLAYRRQMIRREQQRAQFELEKSQLIQQQEHQEMKQQKELNDLKTELYTNITHELRTPLTVIMGMTEQISDHPKEKELIKRNSRRLLRLVNQVMDLSQLEAGRMRLNEKQADIIPFLRYLCESFHSNAKAKQIQLVFGTNLPSLMMDFDDEKIQQIVYNLLSNALKFTPDGGVIQLNVHRETKGRKARLVLEVKDTGKGIPTDDLPHIFDRFYQSSLYHHQQYGGSGIGLALTKQLIELMGGHIEVESTLEKGTTFLIHLPIHQKAAVRESSLSANLETWNEPSTAPHQQVAPNSELPQLLIIEDNTDVITYIQDCLRGQFQISMATNGRQGTTLAYEIIPDLVICDVMMPEKNGYEVCEELKRDTRTSHIPIILLTARADQQGRLAGLKRGADAYLTKPFNKEELLVRINQLIALREKLQQYFLRAGLLSQINSQDSEDPDAVFLQKLQQTVFAQIDNSMLSVNDLSAAVQLGHTQLYRKIKAITGLTPIQFIKKIRLEQATRLLQDRQHSIAEIAYRVGFNDPNYFSRAFQQHFGYPPSEYKDRVTTEVSGDK